MKTALRSLVVGLLIAASVPVYSTSARAASLANCLYATRAGFSYGSYEVTIMNSCGSESWSKSFTLASIQLYLDRSVLNPKTASYYFSSQAAITGTTLRFSVSDYDLQSLGSGTHYPYLRISVPSDYSSSQVQLPSFTTADPLQCIEISNTQVESLSTPIRLAVNLRNTCSQLTTRDFNGITARLDMSFNSFPEQRVFELLSSSSTIYFDLTNVKNGTYSAQLVLKDSKFKTRNLYVSSFTVQRNSTSTPTTYPTTSSGKTKQICAYSKGFDVTCEDYPNFTFEMCSAVRYGKFQEQQSGTWRTLWKVTGKKDSACSRKYPYLISINGTSDQTGTTKNRIVMSGTSSLRGFTQYVTFKVVNQ